MITFSQGPTSYHASVFIFGSSQRDEHRSQALDSSSMHTWYDSPTSEAYQLWQSGRMDPPSKVSSHNENRCCCSCSLAYCCCDWRPARFVLYCSRSRRAKRGKFDLIPRELSDENLSKSSTLICSTNCQFVPV